MTAEDIFDITCTKRQSLSLTHVHEMLSNKKKNMLHRPPLIGLLKDKTFGNNRGRSDNNNYCNASSNAPPKFEPPTPTK
ncbi:hypothetical protein H5410_013254, partial [Solanum commersonii]